MTPSETKATTRVPRQLDVSQAHLSRSLQSTKAWTGSSWRLLVLRAFVIQSLTSNSWLTWVFCFGFAGLFWHEDFVIFVQILQIKSESLRHVTLLEKLISFKNRFLEHLTDAAEIDDFELKWLQNLSTVNYGVEDGSRSSAIKSLIASNHCFGNILCCSPESSVQK